MTSRERVMAALNFKEPDRVPIDIGGGAASYISAVTYAGMLECIGAKDRDIRIYDIVQMLAEPSWEFLNRFQADIVPAGVGLTDDWKGYTLPNGLNINVAGYFRDETLENGNRAAYNSNGEAIAQMPAGASFFNQTRFPYIDEYPEDYSNFEADSARIMWYAMPKDPYHLEGEESFWQRMGENALSLAREKGKAVSVTGGGSFFETGSFFRRIDNFLMDLIADKEEVFRFFDMLLERYLKKIDIIIETMGDNVDIIRFWDDFGMNSGTFFSRETYREMIKPYQKKLCDHIKKRSKMKIFLHTCGSVYDFIPDFIDIGIDVLNPVQISAKNMQPEKLKAEFGKDIAFWGGGCDSAAILPEKSIPEIREHTLENMRILSEGGGYVFAPTHNILSNVPAAAAVAMYDTAIEFNDRRSR